ncbi:unnamed protein product [Didymodactylos carnosus]|uniref:Uncharacterized protein n=1 Tax=Didymodactylos carnosus TaxID=1234261 RepID=A0A814QAF7_9BILA|nr:unnamed protein product [Didymodactylos carnosus]CAF1116953.1 unnamed protein product [Didymodactylos carnosus]CAF3665547.1 unnamed protein product [Didymodactylos carnosus]CAF3880792.1 unnamed protein product [Didymodactylos carnosus]
MSSLVWTRLQPASSTVPNSRSGHSCVIYNDAMHIFGGLGEYRSNELFKFDFVSLTWTELKPTNELTVPSKRCKHSAVVYQNFMYIFGGWDSSGKLNDMYRYNFQTNEWETVQCSNPPTARSAHSVVIYNNFMYLFGGIGHNKYNDMYKFNFKNNQWSVVSQKNPPPKRSSYGGAHIFEDKMYIVCGLGCGKFNDCHCFDFKTLEWTEIKPPSKQRVLPDKRGRHTCVLSGSNLYMFGGYVGIQRSNKLFVFSLETYEWSQIDLKNVPAPREGHSAVLYNGNMFVFGGWYDDGWFNDMYTLGPI